MQHMIPPVTNAFIIVETCFVLGISFLTSARYSFCSCLSNFISCFLDIVFFGTEYFRTFLIFFSHKKHAPNLFFDLERVFILILFLFFQEVLLPTCLPELEIRRAPWQFRFAFYLGSTLAE